MKNKLICTILLISILSSFNIGLFAADNTPEPYNTEEFPQALQDLRRFEIITLGSMPFIMLDSTIAYSAYKSITEEGTEFNFFGSKTYTYEETKKLILVSLGISASIGITDYVVRLIKRTVENNKTKKRNNPEAVRITTTEKQVLNDIDDIFGKNENEVQSLEEFEEQNQEIEEAETEVIEVEE